MRPKTIRVEGFASYRSPVEVDLTGAEFFSLSGATGAGKSSLVDAMIFALYGRVPKLGARAVAPVISAGAERARVAFDFEVGGVGYTAVRLAQRTKGGGASVKEARLQKGDKVIADGASDVTGAVEELLRLRFDDFTRTVVLPQGEFARFLTADKAERQALLRNLLGLDVYTEMRALARTRETVARDRVGIAAARVATLEIPDDGVMTAARRRLDLLEDLAEGVVDREKRLTDLMAESRSAAERVTTIEGRLEHLSNIAPPDRLDELDALAAAARDRVAATGTLAEEAAVELSRTEEAIEALPSPDAVTTMVDAHRRLTEAGERLADLDESNAISAVESTKAALEVAKGRAAGAREAVERERVSHSAHALTLTLEVGGACPVCDQVVTFIPDRDMPAALADLEDAEREAVAVLEEAAEAASNAKTALAALTTARAEVKSQITDLEKALAGAPGAEELSSIAESHRDLSEELVVAKDRLDRRRGDARLAEKELESLSEAIRSVGRELMAAHQVVAELSPPLPASDDPIVQWKEFLVWRDERVDAVAVELENAVEAAEAIRDEVRRFEDEIIAELEAANVTIEAPYAVGVTRELQVARSFVDDVAKSAAEKRELEALIETASAEADVAGALAGHLKADGFERWLMAGAIADLVAGANDRLEQLSEGGYSLHSDESGSFSIMDHHNANEVRSVATLSGGETFLVSLALALSLAETLAARGGADLDAIVIDEGFGTLDDESLDTVASVLEDLAGGLMVGVITHVKELASRAPTRFEVVRDPGGSRVEQVS